MINTNKLKKIIIIQRIFPVYRLAIFNELDKKFNLKLIHGTNKSGIKQIKTNYSHKVRIWKYAKRETNVFINCFWTLFKYKPSIIIHEFSIGIISMPIVLLLVKLTGKKIILWGHGYDRKIGFDPITSKSDKYRLWLMNRADSLLVYGKEAKKELSKYLDANKIFVAQNTLDTELLFNIRNQLEFEGRDNVKNRVGFVHTFNIIFIGRLLSYKKPQILIDIYKYIFSNYKLRIGVHFIGEGAMEILLKNEINLCDHPEDFFLHGPIHDDEKSGELLFSSDLMVIPGSLGLAINHSFAFDCPVASFVGNHPPEIEYVIHNKTGFLFEGTNVELLSQEIYNYLNNKIKQENIRKEVRNMIQENCSLEKMFSGFNGAINYVQ